MQELINALIANGIDPIMAETMIKSIKPKKEKSKSKSTTSNYKTSNPKIEKPITVSTYCQCCGTIHTQEVLVKCYEDSNSIQKLACSVCHKCPEFFRSLPTETLITMLLLNEKPTPELHNATVKFKLRLSEVLTPEKVINFTTLSNMERGK